MTTRNPATVVLQHVLVIDDEKEIRTLVELCLSRVGGFSVQVASGGAKGIELARAHPPDVILLDLMMPGLDGQATLVELRRWEACATVPVIFMTAGAAIWDPAEVRRMGVVGFIVKPFHPTTLADDIRGMLAWVQQARDNDPRPAGASGGNRG